MDLVAGETSNVPYGTPHKCGLDFLRDRRASDLELISLAGKGGALGWFTTYEVDPQEASPQ